MSLAVINNSPTAIIIIIAIVGLLLLVDLFLFARNRQPSVRESIIWSLAWLILGLLVAIPIALLNQPADGINYITVYLIERSLSLDNLVVFLLIFGYFAVPAENRGKLLFWGIVFALAMRGLAIVAGVELLKQFHYAIYALGLLLLFLAWRMWGGAVEHIDPDHNPLVRLTKRFLPMGDYHEGHFFFRAAGRLVATPLLLALIAVVAADIAFALDSIPAAFAITDDPLVIWAANGFALLGLRALFALVEEMKKRFYYLNQTVAIVLGVVALKLLTQDIYKLPPFASLGLVVVIFSVGIILSLRHNRLVDNGAQQQ